MRYEFHPEALEEYRQATVWYAEREQNLALQFVAAVEDAIQQAIDAPFPATTAELRLQKVSTSRSSAVPIRHCY